ncbi:hypothetical protein HMI54_000553 [Coelomomyces lativittatus]|nr:hypothetical protein HMI55_001051 [Coelomomyces lativittatus]KAJ1511757.1 hypothetical protein HMI54_000553 [Coelomomyces lativittatus]KAJ1514231.1 hypothetical protein HMI56_000890 [Coelomomyces lativittatus]
MKLFLRIPYPKRIPFFSLHHSRYLVQEPTFIYPDLTSDSSNKNETVSPSSDTIDVEKEYCKPAHYAKDLISFLNNKEMYIGKPIAEFPRLTDLIKGLRPGEMTVFTGPTGSGKTTFLSQYSLNLAKAGIRTLWGSFEISNVVLVRKMLCQLKQHPFSDFSTITLNSSIQELNQLPLYFMPYHGTTKIQTILQRILDAKEKFGVEHIVLDNLQFFLSGQSNSFIDKFHLQDSVLHELRQFITQHKVHVTIVVHPRKESLSRLTIESISGTAKVTQEADNVLLLHRKPSPRLELIKNRFDGTLGEVPLSFDKYSGLYKEGIETRLDFKSNFSYDE